MKFRSIQCFQYFLIFTISHRLAIWMRNYYCADILASLISINHILLRNNIKTHLLDRYLLLVFVLRNLGKFADIIARFEAGISQFDEEETIRAIIAN